MTNEKYDELRNRVKEEFEIATRIGPRFDIDSAMMIVDEFRAAASAPKVELTDEQILKLADESAINHVTDERRPDNATVIWFARAVLAQAAPVAVPEHWRKKAEHIVSEKMGIAESSAQAIMLLKVMLAAAPSATWIQLGHGAVTIGQGNHEGIPAILFGKNGTGTVGEESEGDRFMEPGELLCAITFRNGASIGVLEEKLRELRARVWPEQFAAPVAPVAAAVPAGKLVPKWSGQFDTHQQWVNKARSWLASPSHAPAVCIDAKGRRCTIGADMARARDEGAFPVRYFWECELPAAPAQETAS